MKKIRKMDELEMSVNLKAVRLAWVFGLVFILVWLAYDWIRLQQFNILLMILLLSQLIIYWMSQLIQNMGLK